MVGEAGSEKGAKIVISPKDKNILIILATYFGTFGIDRFYKGQVGLGLLKLFTFGACGIWSLIDAIMYTIGATPLDSYGQPIIDQKTYNQKKLGLINNNNTSVKDKGTLLLLSGFFGVFGLDRFYRGQVLLGILKLLTAGGCGIWVIIDHLIYLLGGSVKDAEEKWIVDHKTLTIVSDGISPAAGDQKDDKLTSMRDYAPQQSEKIIEIGQDKSNKILIYGATAVGVLALVLLGQFAITQYYKHKNIKESRKEISKIQQKQGSPTVPGLEKASLPHQVQKPVEFDGEKALPNDLLLYLKKNNFEGHLSGFSVYLNGDEIPEWLITSPDNCGSIGCTYTIFFKTRDGWKEVGEIISLGRVGPTSTNGFYDIFGRNRSYSERLGESPKYNYYVHRWDGNKYVEHEISKKMYSLSMKKN